jgi:hypothetical protein
MKFTLLASSILTVSQTGEGHRWTPVVSHGVRGSSPGVRRLYSPAPVQHRRGRSMVAVESPVRASLRLGRGRFRPVRTIRTILRNGRASERPFSGRRARAKRARSRGRVLIGAGAHRLEVTSSGYGRPLPELGQPRCCARIAARRAAWPRRGLPLWPGRGRPARLIAVTTSCAVLRSRVRQAASTGSRLNSAGEVTPTSPVGVM